MNLFYYYDISRPMFLQHFAIFSRRQVNDLCPGLQPTSIVCSGSLTCGENRSRGTVHASVTAVAEILTSMTAVSGSFHAYL